MKKANRKQRRPGKVAAKGNSVGAAAHAEARPGAEAAPAAQQIASAAQDLYGKAHALDRKADALHLSAHAVHEQAAALHGKALPASGPEPGPLVVDDQQPGKSKPFPIVGIGASAGGYEAFAEFLRQLPPDTGMAFVLVLHLDPAHKSQLTELLRRSSNIPVVRVSHGMEVKPDCLFVIPENSTMTIAGGKLCLHPRKQYEVPSMAIDIFFRSLAQAQQSRAIGIVLSGTGSDGTLGIEAIKGEGGLTFAQNDRSSKFFDMPGSAIASGSVDFVLSPTDIARELIRLARHPLVAPGARRRSPKLATEPPDPEHLLVGEAPNDISTLFRLLRARTGVDFSLYKQSTLKRRIARRMALQKKDSLAQYVRLAQTSSAELEALFNDLLINVTSFFRDPNTFKMLQKKVFPRLLKAHTDDSPWRFWVCGCATGEEAYSLAICLVEFFDRVRTRPSVQIFATDISEGGIEKARAGLYPSNIQQDVSPERLRRFFTKANGNFQVQKSIRDMVIFARQNVLVDPPFSNLDLVSCRNVLIYFGPVLQRKVIPLFHYSLRNAGFLLLGSSETIGGSAEHFALLDKKSKVFTKKTTFIRPGFELASKPPEPQAAARRALPEPRPRETKPLDLQTHFEKLLLRDFTPPSIVVNSQLDVIFFRGRTSLYLEHASGAASFNLFKMLHENLSVSVRAAVTKAARQDSPVKHSGIEYRRNGHLYELTIEVVPFRVESLDERFFAVVFREAPNPVVAQPDGKEPPGSAAGRLRRELSRVKLDLQATRESMQSIIEEQEATNEELKSANEEIQSSNEELQSTNEELETAKEELQSTNEELTTLNEELQNRNTELGQLNNDLQNLLASVSIPILMVDNDLTVRRLTAVAERLFNLRPSDIGHRLPDTSRELRVQDLDRVIRQVIDDLTIVEREVQDRDGRFYLMRIRPYRTRENKIEGAVIVLVDVDEQRRAQEAVTNLVRQPILMLGVDLKVHHANKSFFQTFDLTAEQTLGRLIFDIDDKQWDLPALRKLLTEVLPHKKTVNDFIVEAQFSKLGRRKLRLDACRFPEDGNGLPLMLLAIEEVKN